MKNRHCLLCEQIVEKTDYSCGDRPDLFVGRCIGCGLVQLMDFSHVSLSYYADDDYFPSNTESSWTREAHWNINRIFRLERELPNPEHRCVLDFGCGIGGFLKRAQKAFGTVLGYDLSTRVVNEHCKKGFSCYNSLDAVPLNVDTIVMFHVLEHVIRPWELLSKLRIRFPRVDRFVIETPCNDEALVKLFENETYRRNHYSAEHLYYYTNATLTKVVQKAGLKVILDSQLQRYTLGNTFGWLNDGQGGGQDKWPFFNSTEFHSVYENTLVKAGLADSVFLICEPGFHQVDH